MKKILLVALFSFLVSGALVSGEVFDISISPKLGILSGEINEYVFDEQNGLSYTQSRLDWEVNLIPCGGLEIEAIIKKRLSLSVYGIVGLPKRSGFIEDFDWLNMEDLTRNTHYSKHENYLLEYEKIGFSVGWSFYPYEGIEIIPFFSFSGEIFGFDGRYGYTQYAFENGVSFWNPDLPKKESDMSKYLTESVISYSQKRYLLDFGVKTKINLLENLDFSLSGEVGFYNQIMGHDYHWNVDKYTEYVDTIEGIMFSDIGVEAEIIYVLNKHNKISINNSVQRVLKLQGDTFSKIIGKAKWAHKFEDGGGASSTLYSVSLNYTFTF